MTRTRRDLLRAAGVVTVGGLLAGCSGNGGGDGSDGGSDGGDGSDGGSDGSDGGSNGDGSDGGSDGSDGGSNGSDGGSDGGSMNGGPSIGVRNTEEYGDILVDGEGMTLYLFTQDSPDESVCTGDCAVTWPPLIGSNPQAGDGVTAELSTIERSDGSSQVVAGDWPLYYYEPDQEPGDVTGQGVGGVWYVLSPAGEMIRSTGEATTTDSPTPSAGPTVQVGSHPDLGEILTDGDGRTLYMFTQDSEGETACTGSCAENWPPLTGGMPQGGANVTADLGTIERPDGSTQVTADGMPLYYFAGDESSGDANGQGLNGAWYVLGPDGSVLQGTGTTTTTTSGGGPPGGGY